MIKMTEKEKLLNFIDDCIDENIGFKFNGRYSVMENYMLKRLNIPLIC